jgi:hypothetical protein
MLCPMGTSRQLGDPRFVSNDMDGCSKQQRACEEHYAPNTIVQNAIVARPIPLCVSRRVHETMATLFLFLVFNSFSLLHPHVMTALFAIPSITF